MTLYMAGARMAHYFPVSIPYHGSGLNITVQSYAGILEFGLTACRRVVSQEEACEMVGHLRAELEAIRALARSIEDAAVQQSQKHQGRHLMHLPCRRKTKCRRWKTRTRYRPR